MSVGIHVSKKGRAGTKSGMLNAIKEDLEVLNFNAFQCFTHGPRTRNKSMMDYRIINQYTAKNNLYSVVHGSYLSIAIWKVNHQNCHDKVSKIYINHIQDMLKATYQIGAKGLIIHLPKNIPEAIVETMEVLSNCAEIKQLEAANECPTLILEMPASKPDDKTYETPEKLGKLCMMLHHNQKITIDWGICIDTAHQWCGAVSYKEQFSWVTWVDALPPVARERIKVIHLNGSKCSNFGTGRDLHIVPFSKNDGIWGSLISLEMRKFMERVDKNILGINFYDKLSSAERDVIISSGVYEIIYFAKKNKIPIIFEVTDKKTISSEFIEVKFCADVVVGLMKDLDLNV